MIEFNKIQKNSGLGNSQTKKVEEKTKVEQKNVEASSSKALNSYGRAFVNLSFKGKVENNGTNATKETSTNETEALTKEEQEEIIEEIRKFYQDKGYSDDNIDYNIKTLISDDENIRNKQLYAYKKLKEDGAQTIAACAIMSLYKTDNNNAEAKIDFAKQLNAQGYDSLKIARLLYIEEYDKPTDSKK